MNESESNKKERAYSTYNIPRVALPKKYNEVSKLSATQWRSQKFGDPVVVFKIRGISTKIFGKAGGYEGKSESDVVLNDVQNISVIFISKYAYDILEKECKKINDIFSITISRYKIKVMLLRWSKGSAHLRLAERLELTKNEAYELLRDSQLEFMKLF